MTWNVTGTPTEVEPWFTAVDAQTTRVDLEHRYWDRLRLIPPRGDFASTMTDNERAVMGRHVTYWMGHVDAGVALIFSLVADPAGDWGMAVVQTDSLAQVTELENADPVVFEGVGRYEVLPLPHAIANLGVRNT